MEPLFRAEAVAHATRRLDGAVLLPAPLSVWVVGVFVAAALAVGVWFASTATYARKAVAQGWLAPEAGMARAVAPGPGVVSALLVSAGDVVERNAPLARIRRLDRPRVLATHHQALAASSEAAVRQAAPEASRNAPAVPDGATAADEPAGRFEAEDILVAPIGGRVDDVAVRAGQPVATGALIAVVVPVGGELVAELYVPARAAGFVAAGQPLRLRYEAFPFERYGAQDGVVEDVSRTLLSPDETAGSAGIRPREPVFRVRGRLAAQEVDAYGASVPLRAGMRLTADIVVDRRTLGEWLLDPVYAVTKR